MIKIEKFVVNPLGENSYVLYDETGECVFIDPGFYFEEEHEEIKSFIAEKQLKPVNITNTHCHFDHIMGVEFLRGQYNIPFRAHEADNFWVEKAMDQGKMFGFEMHAVRQPEQNIDESQLLTFGNSTLKIIHVPGHSPGHVVFYSEQEKLLIAGDVLFYGSIGRTDLPGGNHAEFIENIKNKVLTLPEETKVYCGHGPETTIGFEKNSNPYLT